jgi:cytoskeleton protein RodZ
MSDQQMNEVPLPQDDGQPAPPLSAPLPGALLAAQRQKKGWSVEQVASLVKLAPRQIQAIEADNYSVLPGLAVARGFVRSYAKALGMDANALAAGMPQESPVAQRDHIVPQYSLSTPFSEGPLPAMMMADRGGGSALVVIVGLLAVALVAGAAAVRWTDLGNDVPQLAWIKAHKSDEAPAPAEPEAAPAAEAASSDTPVNARVETVEPNNAADDAAKSAGAATQSAPAAQQAQPVPTPPVASTPAPAVASAPAAVPAQASVPSPSSGLHIVNSKDLLRLTFREDSWVEIRRADKTTIISRLLKAGTTEAFDVSDATTLIIGNAAGVDATLRGQPLDLKTAGGTNVARLNLN